MRKFCALSGAAAGIAQRFATLPPEGTLAFVLLWHHRMKPILILYATREGHTHRIAEYLAGALKTRGMAVEQHNVKDWAPAAK